MREFTPIGQQQYKNFYSVDADFKGFFGGFTDGNYIYFVPSDHKKLVGMNVYNFSDSGLISLDLNSIDSDYTGYRWGLCDGKYGYLIPHNKADDVIWGKFLRVNLQDFSTSSTTVLDLTSTHSDLKGFCSGFIYKRKAYLCPFQYSKIAIVDLSDFSTVTYLDITRTGNFDSFTDGIYGYFLNTTYLIRVRLADNDITEVNLGRSTYKGMTYIENKIYLSACDYDNSYQTYLTVLDKQDLTLKLDISVTNGTPTRYMSRFKQYIYMLPSINEDNDDQSGYVIRFDKYDLTNIQTYNMKDLESSCNGYYGAVSDGYSLYFANFVNCYMTKLQLYIKGC